MHRLALLALIGVAVVAAPALAAEVTDVSQAEALAATRKTPPPLILDVRTPQEFASGHVPGARNIPHDQVGSQLEAIEDYRESEVILYCERGGRAAQAGRVLTEAGFDKLRHLSGDMKAWREAELPIEKP